MKSNQQTTRRRVIKTGGVALTFGSAGLATTASADSGGGQGILAEGVAEPGDGDLGAFIRGFTSRFSSGYGSPESAENLADRMRNEFNANSDHWISYGNWLAEKEDISVPGSTIVGVDVAITRARWPTRNESVSTTIDAQFDDTTETFSSLEWRTGEPEEPDYEVTLKNKAAESAADELQSFRREYIDTENGEDHELPDEEYLSELVGKYSTSIALGEDSSNVLELLLGGDI